MLYDGREQFYTPYICEFPLINYRSFFSVEGSTAILLTDIHLITIESNVPRFP